MDQREFNRQMGSYLRDRKTEGGIWKRIKNVLPTIEITSEEDEEEQKPEEIPQEKVQAVMRGESVEPEPEEDDGDFAEYDAIEAKESWFDRLADWLFGSYERDELLHEEEDVAVIETQPDQKQVDEDVKEMLRVCVKWINRLPPEEIQSIKREDEYREFKSLLDEYGLLKK